MPVRHGRGVPTRTNPVHDARRRGVWALHEVGRELRLARVVAGRTQRQVGAAVGRSQSRISRIESGSAPRVTLPELMTIAAAVGLKLWIRTVPGVRRPVDAAQLELIGRLNGRLHASWHRRLEAPIPIPGDLRAIDQVINTDGCSIAVEAITRLADVQAQVRSAHLKQRDIGADRLMLLIKGTHANRQLLRQAGPILRDAFPVGTRAAMAALETGRDPGGDALVVL